MSGELQRFAPAETTMRAALRSDAVVVGGLAFLNGVGPRDLENDRKFLADGLEAQAQQMLANLATLLARCGSGLDRLVSVRVHLVQFDRFDERFRAVWAKRFRELSKPGLSIVGVEALPRGSLVALDAIARVGEEGMATFGLIVHFDVDPASMDRFLDLVRQNAECSVRDEPGCRRFDVLVDPARAGRVTLYEIYDDEVAFGAHMKMPHVADFFAQAKALIRTQENTRLDLVAAPVKT